MDHHLFIFVLGAFLAGFATGSGLAAYQLSTSWVAERRDLLNRVHAPSPGDYIALRQATETLDAASSEKSSRGSRSQVDHGEPPWSRDPRYQDVSVDVDAEEGVVYFQDGEDTWEEDAGGFLGRYGLTPADYDAKWGAS